MFIITITIENDIFDLTVLCCCYSTFLSVHNFTKFIDVIQCSNVFAGR